MKTATFFVLLIFTVSAIIGGLYAYTNDLIPSIKTEIPVEKIPQPQQTPTLVESVKSWGGGGSSPPPAPVTLLHQNVTYIAVDSYTLLPIVEPIPTYTYYKDSVKTVNAADPFILPVVEDSQYKVLVEYPDYISNYYSFTGSDIIMSNVTVNMWTLNAPGPGTNILNPDTTGNADDNRYAIGAGNTGSVILNMPIDSDKRYPGGVIVFSSIYDDVIESLSFDSGSATTVPQQFSDLYPGVTGYAFTFPQLNGSDVLDANITFTTKANATTTTSSIEWSLYDSQAAIDSATDQIIIGQVEDSVANDIGATNFVENYIYLD